MRDTSPEMEKRLLQLYAERTPEERMRMAGRMFDTGIALMKAGILQATPDISKAELRERIFRRLYGDCFSEEELQRIARFLARGSAEGA